MTTTEARPLDVTLRELISEALVKVLKNVNCEHSEDFVEKLKAEYNMNEEKANNFLQMLVMVQVKMIAEERTK